MFLNRSSVTPNLLNIGAGNNFNTIDQPVTNNNDFHLPELQRNGNMLSLNKTDIAKANQSDNNVGQNLNNEKYISISFNPASKANSNKRLNDSLTKSEIDKNIGNLLNEGPLEQQQDRPGTKQAPETMKKGMTKFYLNETEEKEYLNYQVIKPEIINWEELQTS